MPIKYIGRTHTYKGKPLWEILANLKNYGVGRIVIRSQQQRYPESSFMKILKVAALPDTSKHPHDPRKCIALIEKTFRGKKCPFIVQIDGSTYKPDHRLIPKDEEANYINATQHLPERIMPRITDLPPLLKEILIRNKRDNIKEDDLKLKLIYSPLGMKSYRVAEENENPTVSIEFGLGEPASPSLYKDVEQENMS